MTVAIATTNVHGLKVHKSRWGFHFVDYPG